MHKAYETNKEEARWRADERGKGRFAVAALVAVVLMIAIALAACAQQSEVSQPISQDSETTEQEVETAGQEVETYEPGVVLVSLKEGVDAKDALGAIEQETGIAGLSITSQGKWYVELALPESVSVEQATEALGQSSVVESAQPNFRYYLMDAAPANVTQLQVGSSSGLRAQSVELDDTYASKLWGLSSVRAFDAWEIARCEGSVTVAVIDNVFRADHEDLQGNVVVAYNAVTQTENDDIAGDSYSRSDKNHGTHVAGIIAAQANNGTGVAGVSYNANLMLFRTAEDDGEFYTTTLLNAYAYAIDNKDEYNVRVLNMSLGGYMENDSWEGKDDQLLRAIDRAWEAGIVTVTSAGNAGYYYVDDKKVMIDAPFSCYPGDYARCVNVMNLENTSSSDPFAVKRDSGSNYNADNRRNKDIAAPGTDIYSTNNTSATSYGNSTGTSMAAPCVSGVLALMFACRPDLTPAQAVRTLYATATDLGEEGFDAEYGNGEVNALAALEMCSDENFDPGDPDNPVDPSGDGGPSDDSGSDDSGDEAAPAAKPAKLANTLTVSAKFPKVKASILKTTSLTLARKAAFAVSKARGTVTYTKVSGSPRLKIAKKTGKITIKKNTKRGVYRMRVKVRAAGNSKYKPRAVTVTVRIRVR